MRIAFLIFAANLAEHQFRLGDTNPGVGGTQFTTIQLALRLAHEQPSWCISLVNSTHIPIVDAPGNLTVEIYSSSADFFARCSPEHFSAVVATVQSTRHVETAKLRAFKERLIAWSRHPYDDRLRLLDQSVGFAAAISVGRYQYYSNGHLRSPSGFIQNIFQPRRISTTPIACPNSGDTLNLVHLGALVAGKGFDKIAQAWAPISRKWPKARLHVIGSGALYRDRALHPNIPVTPQFAEQILRWIPLEDILAGRVIFHGKMGAEKFDVLSQAHIALQNPTGGTEAFPASTLECMSIGLPVIASSDFGMWDSMRFFPELQIRRPLEIVDRVEWLLADASRFDQISQRSLAVAKVCADETESIVDQWVALFDALAGGRCVSNLLVPPLPQPKPRLHFTFRIFTGHWRIILSDTPLGIIWKRLKGVVSAGTRTV
jgi:glycosyltransferase involved in cell wall biosynthesis